MVGRAGAPHRRRGARAGGRGTLAAARPGPATGAGPARSARRAASACSAHGRSSARPGPASSSAVRRPGRPASPRSSSPDRSSAPLRATKRRRVVEVLGGRAAGRGAPRRRRGRRCRGPPRAPTARRPRAAGAAAARGRPGWRTSARPARRWRGGGARSRAARRRRAAACEAAGRRRRRPSPRRGRAASPAGPARPSARGCPRARTVPGCSALLHGLGVARVDAADELLEPAGVDGDARGVVARPRRAGARAATARGRTAAGARPRAARGRAAPRPRARRGPRRTRRCSAGSSTALPGRAERQPDVGGRRRPRRRARRAPGPTCAPNIAPPSCCSHRRSSGPAIGLHLLGHRASPAVVDDLRGDRLDELRQAGRCPRPTRRGSRPRSTWRRRQRGRRSSHSSASRTASSTAGARRRRPTRSPRGGHGLAGGVAGEVPVDRAALVGEQLARAAGAPRRCRPGRRPPPPNSAANGLPGPRARRPPARRRRRLVGVVRRAEAERMCSRWSTSGRMAAGTEGPTMADLVRLHGTPPGAGSHDDHGNRGDGPPAPSPDGFAHGAAAGARRRGRRRGRQRPVGPARSRQRSPRRADVGKVLALDDRRGDVDGVTWRVARRPRPVAGRRSSPASTRRARGRPTSRSSTAGTGPRRGRRSTVARAPRPWSRPPRPPGVAGSCW